MVPLNASLNHETVCNERCSLEWGLKATRVKAAEALCFMCKIKKKNIIYLFWNRNALTSNGHFFTSRLGLEEAFSTSLENSEFRSFVSSRVFGLYKWNMTSFLCSFLPSASLRSELNHIHASAIEHLRQTHQQESAAAKVELEKTLENNRTQVRLWTWTSELY